MESRDKKTGEPAPSRSLREAILQERLKEAEKIDRETDRRGSELARLEILKASLDKAFDEIPSTDDRFVLALNPSEPARLWIDMMSYVTMDTSARLYRFIWNGGRGRKVLAESEDIGEIKSEILEYVAGQIISREREVQGRVVAPAAVSEPSQGSGRGLSIVVWAFVMGLLTGAFCLLALAYLITP